MQNALLNLIKSEDKFGHEVAQFFNDLTLVKPGIFGKVCKPELFTALSGLKKALFKMSLFHRCLEPEEFEFLKANSLPELVTYFELDAEFAIKMVQIYERTSC